MKKIEGWEKYDISWRRTRGDIEELEASVVRETDDGFECPERQQRSDNHGECRDEHSKLFQNKVRIRVVENASGFSAQSFESAGEEEGPIVWLALVDAC